MDKTVETLLKKAVDAHDPTSAMNFAQAACNAANALRSLSDAKLNEKSLNG